METGNLDMKTDKLPPPPAFQLESSPEQSPARPLWQIIMVAAIAAGVQFGWALQLSLLTPYVQLLGIPHTWSSFIWLCGPISGMIVQPLVGYYSDACTSRFGRRRPFIAAGALLVAFAIVLIGYAADIGVATGDKSTGKAAKPRAISGPCRALLADLSGSDSARIRTGNSLFAFFMAVGNVLGYAAGSYTHLYRILPFTKTHACDIYCANLKTCFFISIALLMTITVLALATVKEEVFQPEKKKSPEDKNMIFFVEMIGALKQLSRPMWILLLVTCLNWIAWFPFLMFDTDWMGREVYGGKLGEGAMYNRGVRAGALGLMLNSVVSGVASLSIAHLARVCGGVKRLWGGVNLLLAVCLAMTVVVTKVAESSREFATVDGTVAPLPPSAGVKGGALAVFAVLGIPLSVTFAVPCALASIFSNNSNVGQGLSLGVLNLAIVLPQMVVSILSGPWDALFGGGNLPAFVVGAIAAAISGILAFTLLPSPPPDVVLAKVSGATMH
ncbi:hypothetical protein OSB04_003990 [Centaurea solstitialis]|uniref:Sucrose transporter n=1 Tax=Centaurea solstitialis TaxID=347529 RepID=A0AA38WVF7_9ASTR|nr:hypothetical protein OSB04_003990 [Centaurea solstitialis]